MTQVTVYNAGGVEVLHTVSLKHAIGMLVRQVARIREAVEGERFGQFDRPTAVELTRYVFAKWRYEKTGHLRPSRANILRRDRHKCAFCGRAGDTIDHVTPRCQGGVTSWTNCVTACVDCNSRKAGRTPKQAGMRLRFEPFEPSLHDLYSAGERS